MIILTAVFCLVGVTALIFAELTLHRAHKTREQAETMLDEAAKMHDDTNRMYREMFKTRGLRDLEKLGELVCGLGKDLPQ